VTQEEEGHVKVLGSLATAVPMTARPTPSEKIRGKKPGTNSDFSSDLHIPYVDEGEDKV
jgi:hypothetical protein